MAVTREDAGEAGDGRVALAEPTARHSGGAAPSNPLQTSAPDRCQPSAYLSDRGTDELGAAARQQFDADLIEIRLIRDHMGRELERMDVLFARIDRHQQQNTTGSPSPSCSAERDRAMGHEHIPAGRADRDGAEAGPLSAGAIEGQEPAPIVARSR